MPVPPNPADFDDFPGIDQKHLEFISGLQVDEFAITPDVIKPLQKATIIWKVTHEDGRKVPDLWLTGVGVVAASGSVEVAPLQTTGYQLRIKSLNRGWYGGTRQLSVDRSFCFRQTIPAETVHWLITRSVLGALLTRFPTTVAEWQDASGSGGDLNTLSTTINGSGITVNVPFLDSSGQLPFQGRLSTRIELRVVNGRLTYQIASWNLFRAENLPFGGPTTIAGFFEPLSGYLDPAGGSDTLRQFLIDRLDYLMGFWVPKSKLTLVGLETDGGDLILLRCHPVLGGPRLR